MRLTAHLPSSSGSSPLRKRATTASDAAFLARFLDAAALTFRMRVRSMTILVPTGCCGAPEQVPATIAVASASACRLIASAAASLALHLSASFCSCQARLPPPSAANAL
eukprot:4004020-Prymnesium_polylepis.1